MAAVQRRSLRKSVWRERRGTLRRLLRAASLCAFSTSDIIGAAGQGPTLGPRRASATARSPAGKTTQHEVGGGDPLPSAPAHRRTTEIRGVANFTRPSRGYQPLFEGSGLASCSMVLSPVGSPQPIETSVLYSSRSHATLARSGRAGSPAAARHGAGGLLEQFHRAARRLASDWGRPEPGPSAALDCRPSRQRSGRRDSCVTSFARLANLA
jgi:hypothetical protein